MTMTYKCDKCDATFSKKYNVSRHVDTKHSKQEVETIHCAHCDTKFKRKDNLIVHLKRLHQNIDAFDEPPNKKPSTQKHCQSCDIYVDNDKFPSHVRSFEHLDKFKKTTQTLNIKIIKTAFDSRICSYKITNETHKDEIKTYLETIKTNMLQIIDDNVQIYNSIKFNLELHVKYMKEKSSLSTKIFTTKNLIYDYGQDFGEIFDNQLIKPLVNQSEEFQEYDSGWTLVEVDFLEICINKYDPLYGSSYIALPNWIKQKHAIINVANHDKACFAWSVISALYPVDRQKHPDRVKSYPHYSKMLQLDNITFPMKLTDIPKFESLNQFISINVFGLEDDKIIGPIYHTRQRKDNHINLLHIQNEAGEGHYCWIKDMSRLVGSQLNHKKCRKYICDGCLMNFGSEEKLQSHQKFECGRTVVELPEDERYLKFRSIHKTIRMPFVIYVNFDTLVKPSSSGNGSIHEPFGFSYYVHCAFDSEFDKLRRYHGSNAVNVFWSRLQKDLEWVYVCFKSHEATALASDEKSHLRESDKCRVCDKPFISKDKKIQDHDSYVANCQDPSHPRNTDYQRFEFFVPVILNRLSDHETNFLIREIGFDKEIIEPVAYSNQKSISFTKQVRVEKATVKLRFIDSYRFLSASLKELSSNLDTEKFHMLRNEFPNEEEFDLVKVPSIFPRELLDNESTFEKSSFPAKEDFSNSSGIDLGDEDYQRVESLWSKFECESLGDYADLCMKIDVLHLTDVFENFRTTCMSIYHLDPAHYLSVEDLSWDAMFKATDITLELLIDFEMVQFFKNSIRGGLSQCSKRKAAANNKYMPDFDPEKDSSYLVYLSANNLYDWAMSEPLPTGKFRWLRQSEINSFDMKKIQLDGPKGYILEVDLEYPENIHDFHSDFPFCPEKQNPFELSKNTKLIATVENKSYYVIHHRNLAQCLAHGLILTKIYRILEFEQSNWLNSYIVKNTNLIEGCANDYEKKFYNSMNKAILGKALENVENRIDFKLASHWDNVKNKRGAQYYINLPNYYSTSILNENLVAIQLEKLRVVYDKPLYLGFCIMELTKLRMYDFHYEFMKAKYNTNVELLYTCTDSFIYQVHTDDFYQDIKSNLGFFDTGDYPVCNRYEMPLVNKKSVGKFKDVFDGKLLLEFVGTKSKSYCYVVEDEKPLKHENDLNVSNFRSYLESISNILHNIHTVRFNVYTRLVNKLTPFCANDKRFVIPNSEKTLPWGHNKIKEYCL